MCFHKTWMSKGRYKSRWARYVDVIYTFVKLTPPLLVFCILLTGCDRDSNSQPAGRLQGTWLLDRLGTGINLGVKLHTTTKVDSDGRYSCESVATSSNRVVRFICEGTWQIKDGYLIDTVTNHSDTNIVVPWIVRARIVQITDQELAIHDETNSVDAIFRKAKE